MGNTRKNIISSEWLETSKAVVFLKCGLDIQCDEIDCRVTGYSLVKLQHGHSDNIVYSVVCLIFECYKCTIVFSILHLSVCTLYKIMRIIIEFELNSIL